MISIAFAAACGLVGYALGAVCALALGGRVVLKHERALRNMRRPLESAVRLCDRVAAAAPEPSPAAQKWRDMREQFRAWAEADLECLAREPGTCPPSCPCKAEVRA